MDKFTDTISTIDAELVTDVNKEKGINQPGITEGRSYVDSNGNTRHKYETLVSLSPATIANMREDDTSPKGQRNEKPQKAKSTPSSEKADLVDADEAKSTDSDNKPAKQPKRKTKSIGIPTEK